MTPGSAASASALSLPSSRITATLRSGATYTLRTAEEIRGATIKEHMGDERHWMPAWSPELRESWQAKNRLREEGGPAAMTAEAEHQRLHNELMESLATEWRGVRVSLNAELEQAQEAAEAEQDRLGYTAVHERTEAAWERWGELQHQITATPATTPAGLAARLRYLASISLEGSVPNEDLVVSIADDAERLARGALA
jgi:hypothetical protein